MFYSSWLGVDLVTQLHKPKSPEDVGRGQTRYARERKITWWLRGKVPTSRSGGHEIESQLATVDTELSFFGLFLAQPGVPIAGWTKKLRSKLLFFMDFHNSVLR